MAAPALRIRNLRFRYPESSADDGWVVDVAALELTPGEKRLLTAGSGQGKSTLLHLIAGLVEPERGVIEIDGEDLFALSGPKRDRFRGRRVGMIFQTFNLLHGFSAAENVMAALMVSDVPVSEHRTRAETILGELGIDRTDGNPDKMSVGQQQRIAIARAVACEPVLVLADEPTASLDPENASIAMNLIQSTCERHGAALLCTSHDPAMAERFERSATLEGLKAQGDES